MTKTIIRPNLITFWFLVLHEYFACSGNIQLVILRKDSFVYHATISNEQLVLVFQFNFKMSLGDKSIHQKKLLAVEKDVSVFWFLKKHDE